MMRLLSSRTYNSDSKKRTIYLCVILYKIVLDFTYITASEVYSYRGIVLDFNIIKYALSWFYLFLLMSPFLKKKENVSALVLQMLFAILVIPVLTVYAMKNRSDVFVLLVVLCSLIQCLFIDKLSVRAGTIKFKQGQCFLHLILIFITVITYSVLLMKNRLNFASIGFGDIMYETRAGVDYGFSFIAYTSQWQVRVINPYYIIYGMKKKNYSMVGVFCVLQLLLFFILAQKGILFIPLLTIGTYILVNKFDFRSSFFMGLAVLVLGCFSIYKGTSWIMPFAIIPIRLLFDPALIDFMFYEQFSSNLPKLLFSESRLGRLFGVEYPYSKGSGWIINDIYFPDIEAEANTGYLSYGYADAGFAGMLLVSLLLIFILRVIDMKAEDKMTAFAFCVSAFSSLSNGGLLAALLTGGILLIVFIAMLDEVVFKKKKRNK